MDNHRLQALESWAEDELRQRQWQISGALQLSPIAGDAGFRRYYRLNTEPSLLAVDAPPATEDSQQFLAVGAYLHDSGVPVPDVVAVDLDDGFLLVEDLGEECLLPHLQADSADLLYGEALMVLLRLQQAPRSALLQDYDAEWLQREMQLMPEWFITGLLDLELDSSAAAMLEETFALLCDSAGEQPQVCVHRDYHSRNIVYREGCAPGVIDFQGAVWGPITYDLASLLKDCYIHWPRKRVENWALTYAGIALEAGVLAGSAESFDAQRFLRWFDWIGLQRHIKVLGLFSRLHLRDQKLGYLQDLPLVLHYCLDVAGRYDELKPLQHWLQECVLPAAARQDWYRDCREAGVA